jgi:hypothetical protein
VRQLSKERRICCRIGSQILRFNLIRKCSSIHPSRYVRSEQ